MKIYVSADIEGVAGISAPEEANPDRPECRPFQEQMTREVRAACEGAVLAGASDILVKDAHWHGRNIDGRQLPKITRLLRGWTGHPHSMMAELDRSFAAALMIGYHARAGSGGNPSAHTMSSRLVREMRINGAPASEFLLNTFTATMLGVPVVFLAGDEALCSEVQAYNEKIVVVPTLRGVGPATISIHPEVAETRIRDGVAQALACVASYPVRPLPSHFKLEIDFVKACDAYARSFYPGAELVGDLTTMFRATNWFDCLRMIAFCCR